MTNLGNISKDNQVTIIADPDHMDGEVSERLQQEMQSMHDNGVRHIYLEHDPKEISVDDIVKQQDPYGKMVNHAVQTGMEVHLIDDRSFGNKLDAQYPESSQYVKDNDPNFQDVDTLIKNAPNQQKMEEYLKIKNDTLDYDKDRRTDVMAKNINNDMQKHPNVKAVAFPGSGHMSNANDLDEKLRENGWQTTTVEINSPNTTPNFSRRVDKPDFIIGSENGEILSYKDPKTQQMARAMEGVELPWKNNEAIVQLDRPIEEEQAQSLPQNSVKNVNLER